MISLKKNTVFVFLFLMLFGLNCCSTGHAPGPDTRDEDNRQVSPDPGPDPGVNNPGDPAPDPGKGGGGKK